MKKWKFIIPGIMVVLGLLAYGVYYQFFSYETFQYSDDFQQLSNSKYGTYENKGMVDFDDYDPKIKRHAIGKTTGGEAIFELKDDPSHRQLILMPEMSGMYLLSKSNK